MAIQQGGAITGSILAGADLSANQYGAITAAGVVPAAGALIVGIQQDGGKTGEGPLTGQPVHFVALGFSKVLTNNSAILNGSRLTPAGTTGALMLATAATHEICGLALEANGSTAGRIISALIVQIGRDNAS